MKSTILTVSAIFLFAIGFVIGKIKTRQEFFNNNSYEHLNGYKLDLPEEISEINTVYSGKFDYFSGSKDHVSKIIFVIFDNQRYNYKPREKNIPIDSLMMRDIKRDNQ